MTSINTLQIMPSRISFVKISYCEFSGGMVEADVDCVFKVERWGDHWLVTFFNLRHLIA